MAKKSSRRKAKKVYIKSRQDIRSIIFPCIFVAVLLFGAFLFYQSRRIPEPGEEYQVTKLPSDVSRVLGSTIGPSTKPAISIRIPIFLYHYVEYVQDINDKGRISLNIPPHILTAQIETLKSAGYTFITPNDLTLALSGYKRFPQKIIMLTFDDGYMDFFTDVFPILKKEQIKAVAYIVPNFLDRPNYMFTYQLQEVAKSPYVEIGAHTMDHVWLQGIATARAQYEIAQSRKTLQNMLHLPINSFAYPYGAFDEQGIQLVKDAGFTNAVSTIPGIQVSQDTEYFLYRLRPGYRTGYGLLSFLTQNTFKPW